MDIITGGCGHVQHCLANLLHTYILLRWPIQEDHKKAYQEYLKEKTFRTVVIYFAIKNIFLSNMRSLYMLLCVASH
jgi:hypothetical protein